VSAAAQSCRCRRVNPKAISARPRCPASDLQRRHFCHYRFPASPDPPRLPGHGNEMLASVQDVSGLAGLSVVRAWAVFVPQPFQGVHRKPPTLGIDSSSARRKAAAAIAA
jgi:hypothetical protein